MTAISVEFAGATSEATIKLNQAVVEAETVTRRLLENAASLNHDDVQYTLLRADRWHSLQWGLFWKSLSRSNSELDNLLFRMVVGIVLCGLIVPDVIMGLAQDPGLSFMTPLSQFGTMPYLSAACAFFMTKFYYQRKALCVEFEKAGIYRSFLNWLPAGHMYRGWAVTEHALYMVEADNDGSNAGVKRVPWSEVSTVLYINDEASCEVLRILDLKGQVLQGIVCPRETNGVSSAIIADFMRAKIAKSAIPYS